MDSKNISVLLAMTDKNYSDIGRHLGRSRQSVSLTKKKGSWSGNDLIKIANMTGCKLSFTDKDGNILVNLS